jgi:hypothetical protein
MTAFPQWFPPELQLPTLRSQGIDPADLVKRVTSAESGGNPNLKNSESSATGLGQFTDKTWRHMIETYRPNLKNWRTDAEVLSLRSDPILSRQMALLYAEENAAALKKANLPVTPATIYLMHFLGPGDARKVLRASPDTPAASIVNPATLQPEQNQKIILPRTASQMVDWASDKMRVPRQPWPSQ